MSGLRDSLGEWAVARGDEVAAATRVREPATRAAIGRRRTRNLATTAGVAVLVVAAASTLAVAAPWNGDQPVAVGPDIHLGATGLECGVPWTLPEGTITHDASAPAYFGGVSGDWIRTTDNGQRSTDPESLWVGYESLKWEGLVAVNGTLDINAAVVAVKDGVIVGSNSPLLDQNMRFDGTELVVSSPLPGECGDTAQPQPSGDYEYHVVITATLLGETDRLLQTIVDPSGPLTVEVSPLEDLYDNQPVQEPDDVIVPQSSSYPAYVVAPPEGHTACDPLQELRALGEPNSLRMEYRVAIPGLQPLTENYLPLAIADESVADEWYFDLPAWLVFDDPGTSHEPPLRWDPETFTLDAAEDNPRPPGWLDCPNTANYIPPSGGTWLVIDGVDTVGLDQAYPGADYIIEENAQTWVYLGELES